MANQKSHARHKVILCMRLRPSLPLLAQNSKWSAGFRLFVYPHRLTVNAKHQYSPRSVWRTIHMSTFGVIFEERAAILGNL